MLDKLDPMQIDNRTVFKAIHGNVIGVVEKPAIIDPSIPIAKQYLVKIGAIDRTADFPRSDVEAVIKDLKQFCQRLIP